MKTTEAIRGLVEHTVAALGYELVDVEFKKEQADWVLTLFIDKQGGVSVEDCERVSRAVEPLIDEADPIAQQYFLSVSSPGLDRPLKTERDFARNMGKMVTVKLYQQVEKKKAFTGTLLKADELGVTIACKDNQERTFLRKELAQVKPYISF